MSNNITTGILAVLCVMLSIYSVVQYTKVSKLEYEVMTSRVLVQRSEESVKEMKRVAEASTAEAQRQAALAKQQLELCSKRK